MADAPLFHRNVPVTSGASRDLHSDPPALDPGQVTSGDLGTQEVTVASDRIANSVSLLFGLVAIAVIAYGVVRYRPRARDLVWPVVALAPWLALASSAVMNGQAIAPVSFGYPVLALAIWLCPPSRSSLVLIGVLGAISASTSIVMAVFWPGLSIMSSGKALFGGLLAGPYLHANILGITLALSLPFAFSIANLALRWASVALILGALVWSGARTSQFAAVIVVIGYLLMKRFPQRRWPMLGITAAGFSVVAAVPVLTTDPTALTHRGQIWAALLNRWSDEPILGGGSAVFLEPEVIEATGSAISHAHNGVVQILATSRLVSLTLVVLLVAVAWKNSIHLAATGITAPTLFIAAFAFVSILEASHLQMTMFGYFSWLPLLIISRLDVSAHATMPLSLG